MNDAPETCPLCNGICDPHEGCECIWWKCQECGYAFHAIWRGPQGHVNINSPITGWPMTREEEDQAAENQQEIKGLQHIVIIPKKVTRQFDRHF